MKGIRFVLATLLGAGCAAQADRTGVAPSEVVHIATDLDATCAAGPRDRFEYDRTAVPRDPSKCRRVVDEPPALRLDDDAPVATRARAVAKFLCGDAAPSPVDARAVSTAMQRAPVPE